MHFFALGQSFEQQNIDWLREVVREGHPVGNHTYDHINVKATKPEEMQFLYQRAPWLVQGKTAREVIIDNVRLTSLAFQERLGIKPAGLRTPGGFPNALDDRPDLQELFLSLGFPWVSAKYPAHAMNKPGEAPAAEVFQNILRAQPAAQPYTYANGLIEISRSPTSDINAFRTGLWKLDQYLKAIRLGLEWAIENSAVYVFLGHPSCLLVADPRMEALQLVCKLVDEAKGRAAIVDMDTIATRTRSRTAA
jgi:peptidoglycan/xylan/chitin deacetylase (PgdA/CDA1 family)